MAIRLVSECSLTYTRRVTPRARPMTPEDRREALVEATIPLLHEHGRGVTTKQIADAAGVAEGTIFRVFDSKDDLVTAALEKALDMEPFLADLESIDLDQAAPRAARRPLRAAPGPLPRHLPR